MVASVSRVTENGQITLPDEIRRALGINASDSVLVSLRDGVIEIRRAPNIEDFLQSIDPLQFPEDFDALEDAYESGVAHEAMESKGRGSGDLQS